MAGQAPSRREVLQALACASIASSAPGFFQWAYAFAEPTPQHESHHRPLQPPPKRAAAYQPRFFTPPEYTTIVEVAELILPRTAAATPSVPAHSSTTRSISLRPADAGATDAGAAEFIDFMVFEDASLQPVFRRGLAWLDSASSAHNFKAASRAEQTSLLESIAYRKKFRVEDKTGQEFFVAMRRLTVMGFYTSRIGLESLDYPGLRFYSSSPAVPQDGSLEGMGGSR